MAKRKRKVDRIWWTTANLTVGHTFDGEHIINNLEPRYNCAHTELCAGRRRSMCKKTGLCDKAMPGCESDWAKRAGVSYGTWSRLEGSDLSMMKKMVLKEIEKEFRKCRRVRVLIEEVDK